MTVSVRYCIFIRISYHSYIATFLNWLIVWKVDWKAILSYTKRFYQLLRLSILLSQEAKTWKSFSVQNEDNVLYFLSENSFEILLQIIAIFYFQKILELEIFVKPVIFGRTVYTAKSRSNPNLWKRHSERVKTWGSTVQIHLQNFIKCYEDRKKPWDEMTL